MTTTPRRPAATQSPSRRRRLRAGRGVAAAGQRGRAAARTQHGERAPHRRVLLGRNPCRRSLVLSSARCTVSATTPAYWTARPGSTSGTRTQETPRERRLYPPGPDRPRRRRAQRQGCEECLAAGGRWMHLRRCAVCGHIGCCDSSPGKHARRHWQETGHAIVQSFEPGEDWMYCFADDVVFEVEELAGLAEPRRSSAAVTVARRRREFGRTAECERIAGDARRSQSPRQALRAVQLRRLRRRARLLRLLADAVAAAAEPAAAGTGQRALHRRRLRPRRPALLGRRRKATSWRPSRRGRRIAWIASRWPASSSSCRPSYVGGVWNNETRELMTLDPVSAVDAGGGAADRAAHLVHPAGDRAPAALGGARRRQPALALDAAERRHRPRRRPRRAPAARRVQRPARPRRRRWPTPSTARPTTRPPRA